MKESDARGISPPNAVFRMWVCGPFLLESPDGSSVPVKDWGGSQDARRLLKVLWCKGRSAERSDLIGALWPDKDAEEAGTLLYDAVYHLRKVLKPTPQAESLLLALDKSALRLPGQERLWVDADAALDWLEQAEDAQTSGRDPLLLVEQAASYLTRGTLEEMAGWANGKRRTLIDARHGCLLWQAELYAQRSLLRKSERVLRSLWEEDLADEDALSRLMLNLHQQQRTSEALKLYESLVDFLSSEGDVPLEGTQALADQLRREPQAALRTAASALLVVPSAPQLLQPVEPKTRLFFLPEDGMQTPGPTGISSLGLADPTAWIGSKLANLLSIIEYYCGRPTYCLELQTIIGGELNTMPPNSNEGYTLSRRQALVTLATMPTALLVSILQGRLSTGRIEQLLSRCAASLTACWHLMRGSEYHLVEELLATYLPLLETLAQDASLKYQPLAASLTTQGYRLKGILALHRNSVKDRDAYFQKAVYYAEVAGNSGLLVAALISLAYHKANPAEARRLYQKALHHENAISPLQRSRLYAELSVAYAQENRETEALHSLCEAQNAYPEYPQNDPSYLYAEFSQSSMVMESGRVHLALTHHQPNNEEHPKQAWTTFASIEEGPAKLVASERIRYEIINYQAETALALRERDLCCDYVDLGVRGAELLGSARRRKEILATRNKVLKIWPHDLRVRELKKLFA